MNSYQNTVTSIIGKAVKYFGLFYLTFLLASCASLPKQSDMNYAIAPGQANMQESISAHDLHKILTSRFGYVRIKLSDAKYTLPEDAEVVQLLHPSYDLTNTDDTRRQAHWDSDDFAIAAMVPLRNYAFGAMFVTASNGDRHVINLFVNNRKEIVLWDSQHSQYYQGQINKPELILI